MRVVIHSKYAKGILMIIICNTYCYRLSVRKIGGSLNLKKLRLLGCGKDFGLLFFSQKKQCQINSIGNSELY